MLLRTCWVPQAACSTQPPLCNVHQFACIPFEVRQPLTLVLTSGRFDTHHFRFRGCPQFRYKVKNIPKWNVLIGFLKARGFTWQTHSSTKLITSDKRRVRRGPQKLSLVWKTTQTHRPFEASHFSKWRAMFSNGPVGVFYVSSRVV